MDKVRFIFWEAMKTLSLAFLGLLAAKAVGSLQTEGPETAARRLAFVRGVLYTAVLVMVILGARSVGNDVAAEVYFWASQDNLTHSQIPKAYANALRAVRLRPGVLRYWRELASTKFVQQQFAALLEDQPVFQSLGGGDLEEEDTIRFAYCYFFLAEYDRVIPLTQQLIRENRFYAPPYVLQGMTYTAQKKYPEAERCFLDVLQIFPNRPDAVEGLAHVYFLTGNTTRALAVLNETAKYRFSPEARKRFEALKAFYAQ